MPAGRSPLSDALARIPDEPAWVETRGMLLSGRARIVADEDAGPRGAGFVVVVPDVSLAGLVASPAAALIRAAVGALAGDVNVLAQNDDADAAAAALPGWRRHTAVLHVLPGIMPWEDDRDPDARVFTREQAPALHHVPEPLRLELLDALRGRTTARFVPGDVPDPARLPALSPIPVAAVWAGREPVAFCYPVWQTERWWDVSIDTLAPFRRRGFGARAARALVRHMRRAGRAPVWGALDTNTASRQLAARLGFIETGGIAVFTKG